MSSYSEHIANLSHAGGLPRAAQQGGSAAALVAATEALRKTHTELLVEIEAMRKQFVTEKRAHEVELVAERKAHDAKLREERATLDERARQVGDILRREFGQHSKRLPVMERQLAAIDEALAR
jgi:hypothetical protein